MASETEVRGWRALPPILIVAIALDAVAALGGVVWAQWEHVLPSEQKWGLAIRGVYFAISVLMIAGYLDLARRRTGWAARGLRLAALVVALDTLLWLIVAWYYTIHHGEAPSWFAMLWKIAALVLRATPAILLAIGARDRRVLAIAGVAIMAAISAGHWWLNDLAKWLDLGEKGFMALVSALSLAATVAMALLAIGVARGPTGAEPRRAATGLSRAASALQLRIFAVLAGTGILVLVGMTSSGGGGEGAASAVKLGMFSGLLINFLADLVLATGVIEASRAALPDLPRWPLAIAAATVAWCAGALLEKAPDVYEVLYGSHQAGREGMETIALFSVAVPLIETLGIGVVAAVIGALANRRADEQLRVHVSGKGVGFVGLMLAGVGITQWVVPEAKSAGGLIIMLLCVLSAILYAMILMMRLCRLGAEAVEREPGLPAATVVQS